ncbi:MAG: Gfo/Idh/MocA family oxidoreductase [Verrucomicrobiae bacterium]|nr:Gfo/Idh/MocA family oxidoreductase [Verrucomicrobiae bacterium]
MKSPEQNSDNSNQTSRRNFLRLTGAAIPTIAIAGLEVSRFAHAAGSDIIRVGMIGCGGRNAGAAVQALRADNGARLVAMCDIFMDRVKAKREEIKKQLPDQVTVDDEHCFVGLESYKKVIESSDVVLIANAAKFHPLHMMTAIEAGKHVFVEKPHGIDPDGLKLTAKACELAKEKKLSVVSGLHSRHHPGYAETVQKIHDGAIGDIVTIEEKFLRPPYGVIPRNPSLTELQWQLSTQYHFNWLSGDDVVQSLVHNLDRATWALNGLTPIKCYGMGGRSSMVEQIYGNVFDHHAVIYEYANGIKLFAFCRTTTGCYDEYSSIVHGTKGKASIMACRIWGETNWRSQANGDPYQIEHNKLFAAIRSGTPINNGDYMVKSTMIAVMGQISCYTGKEVPWEQINNSVFYYPQKPEDCRDDMEPPVKPGPDGSYPVYIPGKTKLI